MVLISPTETLETSEYVFRLKKLVCKSELGRKNVQMFRFKSDPNNLNRSQRSKKMTETVEKIENNEIRTGEQFIITSQKLK